MAYSTSTTHGLLQLFLFIVQLSQLTSSEIIGIPTIDCRPDGIEASINLTKPFLGRIYLRGHYAEDGCFHDFSNRSTTWAKPVFSYEACHMRRKRQSDPHGLIMTAVMIISHHSKLITYRDKAFNIECFYEQSDPSPVITDLNVSSNDAAIITMKAETSLPTCGYHVEMKSVKIGEPSNEKNPIIAVGDEVTHIWTCANDQPNNLYCMQVHSCVAEDDNADRVMVIDSRGCSTDNELLSAIQYTSGLRAYATSRVFKFADRNDIRFQCQIRLTVRRHQSNETCPVPDCSTIYNSKKIVKRSLRKYDIDVETERMTVLEATEFSHQEQCPPTDCTYMFLPFVVMITIFFIYCIFTICYCCNMRRMSELVFSISPTY